MTTTFKLIRDIHCVCFTQRSLERTMTMPMQVGETYLVRDGVDNWVGEVTAIFANVVEMKNASWVAESGRLSVFVATGKAEGMEIEPVGAVGIHWRTYIVWPHKLFTKAIG